MTNEREQIARYRARDPFAIARSLFGFDPFVGLESRGAKASFAPAFEVKETSEEYVISADLPGIKEDEVEISLHNNVLNISGFRKSEERKEGDTYFVYERQYGQFTRAFSLPDEADGEKIAAHMKDGVLNVRIAKKADSQPRKIALGSK